MSEPTYDASHATGRAADAAATLKEAIDLMPSEDVFANHKAELEWICSLIFKRIRMIDATSRYLMERQAS